MQQTISERFNRGGMPLTFNVVVPATDDIDIDEVEAMLDLEDLYEQIIHARPSDIMVDYIKYWAAFKLDLLPEKVAARYTESYKNGVSAEQIITIIVTI